MANPTCGTRDTGDRMNGVVTGSDRHDYSLRRYVLIDDMEQGGKRWRPLSAGMGGFPGLDFWTRRK